LAQRAERSTRRDSGRLRTRTWIVGKHTPHGSATYRSAVASGRPNMKSARVSVKLEWRGGWCCATAAWAAQATQHDSALGTDHSWAPAAVTSASRGRCHPRPTRPLLHLADRLEDPLEVRGGDANPGIVMSRAGSESTNNAAATAHTRAAFEDPTPIREYPSDMAPFSSRSKPRYAFVWVMLGIVAALLAGTVLYQFIRQLP